MLTLLGPFPWATRGSVSYSLFTSKALSLLNFISTSSKKKRRKNLTNIPDKTVGVLLRMILYIINLSQQSFNNTYCSIQVHEDLCFVIQLQLKLILSRESIKKFMWVNCPCCMDNKWIIMLHLKFVLGFKMFKSIKQEIHVTVTICVWVWLLSLTTWSKGKGIKVSSNSPSFSHPCLVSN